MTDEELLIWLRVEDTNLTDFAADRIEALIEESSRRLALARSEGVARVEQFERNEALTKELNTCRMAQAVMDNTVADLEAKLAKAVEAGQTMDDGCDCERCSKARATLAEIKGESRD